MPPPSPTLFGHPTGLYTLFFAEMWERFSYYGMRALLLFYMIKGFLGYGDTDAYAVYGAYTALVYLTPFFGGMLADRLLGARRAVVLGGLLMAAGHLLMTIEDQTAFFGALALLICGNGFFKPNISTMVGSLYPQGSTKRDAGFTLFYMGINLGAAMSPLLCGYIGETYGWHYGFGLATVGMLTGLAVFVMPRRVAQVLILGGAVVAAFGLFVFRPDSAALIAINVLVGVALLAAGGIAWVALQRGGLPAAAGAPPDLERLRRRAVGPISREWMVYLATLLAVPVVVLFVSGFAPFASSGGGVTLLPAEWLERLRDGGALAQVLAVVAAEMSRPAGLVLVLSGVGALGYLLAQTLKLDKVPRERMFVVLVLTFFSLAFWAFFEQAGSSVNNFTDRNVDRVRQARVVTVAEVGSQLRLQPTQEQLGYHNGARLFTLDDLTALREAHRDEPDFAIDWQVAQDNVGMGVASRSAETPASVFQALNPIYILIFGLAFTALWGFLGSRGREPATPTKFALGLAQLGLGFGAFYLGAQFADERGMVAVGWLALGYLLHTSGELCLSPVGLAMVTRLSPARLVSTVMGAWFLATAFSQFVAAIIAQFTGVVGDAESAVPVPSDTLDVYAGVFGNIAAMAVLLGAVCWALSPLLKRWMHEEAAGTPPSSEAHGWRPGLRRRRRLVASRPPSSPAVLHTLAVANYRSLKDLVLPLGALNVVTGANGSGKSNLYRGLRLLSQTAFGTAIESLAAEGGIESALWAGPEQLAASVRRGEGPVQGGPRRGRVHLRFGFAGEDFAYAIDFGLPTPVPRTMFGKDPEIKREVIWRGGVWHATRAVVDRRGPAVRARDDSGAWQVIEQHLPTFDSVLARLADPRLAPEALLLRERIRSWRFYDHFRTDGGSPARQAQVGVRTPVLANDGRDLASAWRTIMEIGDASALEEAVADAFPGGRVDVVAESGRFRLAFSQHGLLRPLSQAELSDGTLRYLLWVAALLTPRPPSLMVLNEPETSLHPDLLPPLGRLMRKCARNTQVWVTSHAASIIDALTLADEANHLHLGKEFGETHLVGVDALDAPPWRWPAR